MSGEASFEEALDANRSGRLGDAQQARIESGVRARHNGISGRLAMRLDLRWIDVKAGRVESIDGAVTKKTEPLGFGEAQPGTQYVIRVADRERGVKRFNAIGELWDLVPEAGFVRLYYLPRSRWAVNFEAIDPPTDAPAAEATPEGLRSAAAAFTAARGSGDRVGQAEAFAAVHSIEEQVTGSATGADGAAQEDAPLEQAIVGAWRSPLMRLGLELRADGTLVGELPDGSRHDGRWSLEGSRLSAELPGTPIEADAAVSGDRLTLTMDGQSLAFERAG